jgi:Bacterial regulatory helix-turn-helix protein, lysR family
MVRDELSVMSAFLAVPDERSFTKAAKRLRVTQSALSHAIRGLEEQVGVRLLARTTRSVAPTEAGEQLLAELRPALTGIRGALDRIGGLRDAPRGRVRVLIPRLAAMTVLGPKLARFARKYPDVVLDVSTDETRLDLLPINSARVSERAALIDGGNGVRWAGRILLTSLPSKCRVANVRPNPVFRYGSSALRFGSATLFGTISAIG